ncbi:MAG: cell division protein SepF [Firmicutes bacterium]|nr:cell division protein SepF [Bacillota bacterium]
MAKLVDRVLGLMGYREEEEEVVEEELVPDQQAAALEQDPEEDRPAGRRETGKRPRLVNFPGQSGQFRVIVMEVHEFDDVQEIANHLKNRRSVIINLSQCETDLVKRIVDFLSGTTYALEGRAQKLADNLYLFAPANVVIDVEGEGYTSSGLEFLEPSPEPEEPEWPSAREKRRNL